MSWSARASLGLLCPPSPSSSLFSVGQRIHYLTFYPIALLAQFLLA